MTLEELKERLKSKGYVYFDDNKPYNVNLVGVRSKNRRAGKFDDKFILAYRNRSLEQKYFVFPCTTDPSDYYLQKPLSSGGTAIVVEGQYRGLWQLGKHQGRYTALVQRKPIAVYRDNNRDNILDMDKRTIETGFFGINCHHAGFLKRETVDLYSAGCQVLQNYSDFDLIIKTCKVSATIYGNSFTYTLLND